MRKLLVFIVLLFTSAFQFCSAQDISGTFAIKNVETGIYLRIKDANKKDGTPIVAYSPVNWKCVTWEFQKENANTYHLKNLFSGKTLQPVTTAADGTALIELPVNASGDDQQYEFVSVQKNIYYIKLKGTELYVTPSDNKGEINNPIILKAKTPGKLQQWTLVEQHPEI